MTSKADLIRIRTFQTGDADSVFAVILPIQQCEFDIPISADDQPDIRDVEGFYRQGSGEFWVAEADGHIVGTIALKDIGQGQAALRKMFVAKAYRGSEFGTAHKLLATLISHAHERGVTKYCLERPRSFWAHIGFMKRTASWKSPIQIYRKIFRGWLSIQNSMQ